MLLTPTTNGSPEDPSQPNSTALGDLTDPTWREAVLTALHAGPDDGTIVEGTTIAGSLAQSLGGGAGNWEATQMLLAAANCVLKCDRFSFEELRAATTATDDEIGLIDWAYEEATRICGDNFFWSDTTSARRAAFGIGLGVVKSYDGVGRFIAFCMIGLIEQAVGVIDSVESP